MKVWEKIKELKTPDDQDVNYKTVYDWMWLNKICPIMLNESLDIDESEFPVSLFQAMDDVCNRSLFIECGENCLAAFLNKEIL